MTPGDDLHLTTQPPLSVLLLAGQHLPPTIRFVLVTLRHIPYLQTIHDHQAT